MAPTCDRCAFFPLLSCSVLSAYLPLRPTSYGYNGHQAMGGAAFVALRPSYSTTVVFHLFHLFLFLLPVLSFRLKSHRIWLGRMRSCYRYAKSMRKCEANRLANWHLTTCWAVCETICLVRLCDRSGTRPSAFHTADCSMGVRTQLVSSCLP